ncbi:MAG TPA: dipeptide epimerase [Planctomycetota bacterium]|nr:dipeptide epimerase [Planctomycetota bacterium]
MKLTHRTETLRLRHTFTISRESQDVVPVVIAEVRHEGIAGTGEASPNRYYAETAEGVETELAGLADWLEGKDPARFVHLLEEARERLGANRAALCALDLAVHDWAGRKAGLPLHRLLGLDPARLPRTSFTIGIDSKDRMVEKLREAAAYSIIKVKLGTREDLELVRALRKETRATFRVDANCAWSVRETIEKSAELKALGVELIEQPLPPEANEAMEEVHACSALPVIADESSIVPEDVPGLRGRFHGINVKLVKCGGIQPALRMIHLARAFGMRVMIGCMIESSVACTAAAQIGPLVDYLDIDGPLLITNDPYSGVEYAGSDLKLPAGPGLGVARRGG